MSDDKSWGRRLVICCDGTWQSSVSAKENVPSNVTKLCRLIAREGVDKTNPSKKWHQIVYYDSGVGTGNISDLERNRQGGIGAGLSENVIEAYNFIVMNYVPGDEIFCFGFSRGAYTARAVAGLVTDIGVMRPLDMLLFPKVYRAFQMNQDGKPLRETQAWKDFFNGKLTKRGEELSKKGGKWGVVEQAQGWDIRPHGDLAVTEESRKVKVVGVWDTVGSLGIPDVGVLDNTSLRKKHGFHNVKLNENIEHAYHALALDECRKAFRPTLWYIPTGMPARLAKEGKPIPELKQVWFPGVHINIGGGSDDCIQEMKGDLDNLANATLVWMLQVISPHLTIDQGAFLQTLTQHQRWLEQIRYACTYHHAANDGWADWAKAKIPNIPYVNPADDELTPPKRDPPHAHDKFDYGWGTGNIVDSYTGMYKVPGGKLPRVPGHCQGEILDEKAQPPTLRMADIKDYGETNEYIHPICAYRNIIRKHEANSALRNFDRMFEAKTGTTGAKGRYWWHHKPDSEHKADATPMPEWIILRDEDSGGDSDVNFERTWYGQCEVSAQAAQALKKEGVNGDWLKSLDEQIDFGVGYKSQWEYP